jgi:hypothetical protein
MKSSQAPVDTIEAEVLCQPVLEFISSLINRSIRVRQKQLTCDAQCRESGYI